jgi:hypothetical protein
MTNYFSVNRRNQGHWDVYVDKCRAFCLRGELGCWYVIDERTRQSPRLPPFKEQSAAMSYICAELMHEPPIEG